jgi:hypothetical protein
MKLAINPFLSLGVALAASAIAGLPALAVVSLTNPTISGTYANNLDHFYLRGSSGGFVTPLSPNPQDPTQLASVLIGNSVTPGGNVELNGIALPGYNFNNSVSLNGNLDSDTITLSSLTLSDWNTVQSNGSTLTDNWLSEVLLSNGIVTTPALFNTIRTQFINNNGRQRFSDPNIAYVSQAVSGGNVSVGLAGILNASDLLKAVVGSALAPLVPATLQASELVKATYKGTTTYQYSFSATNSGQSDLGPPPFPSFARSSYSGNYDLTILAGQTSGDPLLPVPPDPENPGFIFPDVVVGDLDGGFGITQPIFFDPIVAVGYDYSVTGGPLFASVLIPKALPGGDSNFLLELGSFGNFSLVAGTPFNLRLVNPLGFSDFRISGIDPNELLDPDNPFAFVTGITFTKPGVVNVKQIPITENFDPVTTPESSSIVGLGLFGLGFLLIKRRQK